jgi:hypothetical protein
MQRKLLSWLFVGFVVTAASCKKDDDVQIAAPDVQAAKTTDTLYAGGSTVLHPQVNLKSGLTYKWTLDGAAVGTDSVYEFKPTASGDFQVVFEATNSTGKNAVTYKIHVWGKYENGFFLLSEGDFSRASGNVSFYDYGLDTIYKNAYTTENEGKSIGTSFTTLQTGTIYNNKLYLVETYGGPLVATDASTLKETGRIETLPGNNGRAFIGIDDTRGLLSTEVGLYPVTLSTLALGSTISSVDGKDVGDMIKVGNYIFVLSATEGIIALNTSDYSVAKKLGFAVGGFAAGKDGNIYAASATALININPSTLAVDSIKTGFDVRFNEYGYTSSSIVASTSDNAVYVISGNAVYRYVPGNAGSITTPFITLPAGQYFYGKGIGYDKVKNLLVLNTNAAAYGNSTSNSIYLYNASTAALTHTVTYSGSYYMGMTVFH